MKILQERSTAVIITEFLKEFYGATAFVPKSICVPYLEDLELLQNFLTMKKGSKVELKIPQKGDKKNLLEMVKNNAKVTLEQFKIKIICEKVLQSETLKQLSEVLELEDVPQRMEAYDISNIQGVDSVGSMIVFEKGKPKNSDFRRFKIKNC